VLADADRTVLTGRLSPRTQPWLGPERTDGRVDVPGAVFAELAIRAGDQVGAPHIAELDLLAPLAVGRDGAVLQVGVGAPGDRGRR
ncbi:polyketide synthase dehydratase domain-containing protein, partial [Pseudonocardia sp. SID8383]